MSKKSEQVDQSYRGAQDPSQGNPGKTAKNAPFRKKKSKKNKKKK
jgi:hypothetical protein